MPQSPSRLLREAAQELERFNHNVEQGFLDLGARLANFGATAGLISADLAKVADLISGAQGERASRALTTALNLFIGKKARSEDVAGSLDQLNAHAERLKGLLARCGNAVAAFRSLGLLTRIETARLGGAGSDFSALSEDVRSLTRTVESEVEYALQTSGELIPQIKSSLNHVTALAVGQAEELPALIAQVGESLSTLSEIRRRAGESSVRLGSEYGRVSTAFNQVIVSFQFNDIVRQQVEHVIESLLRLSSPPPGQPGFAQLRAEDTAAVLQLQVMQLADAGQRLGKSAGDLLASLQGMAMNITGMVEETGSLAGTNGNEQNSLLARMDEDCAAILNSLGEYTRVEAEINKDRAGPSEKIALIRASVEKMRATEMRMRQVAINARISALHLGEPGKALSALADAINQQAGLSGTASESVLETLSSASVLAVRLKQDDESLTDIAASDENRCLEELDSAVSDLRDVDALSSQQMREIAGRGKKLCDDLATARERFAAAVLTKDTLKRLRLELEDAMTHSAAWGAGEAPAALDWTWFTKRYTMREEHDVFRRLSGAVDHAPAPLPHVAEPAAEDNVEFF